MKKFILVEVEIQDHCDDCGGGTDAHVVTKQFEAAEALKDPDFRRLLIEQGWGDVQALKELSPESFGPRLVDVSYNRYFGGAHLNACLVDSKNKDAIPLAFGDNERFFALELSEESVKELCPEAYEEYQKLTARRERYRQAQKKRLATLAAKKLIEKAGA